jgi:HK97 family phage prohead protease
MSEIIRLFDSTQRLFTSGSSSGIASLRSAARLDAAGTPQKEMKIRSRLTWYSKPTVKLRDAFHFRFAPGAFTKGLREYTDRWIFADHNADAVLGREGRNARIWEDKKGLLFEATLPDTGLGRDVYELVRTGLKVEASVGFKSDPEHDRWLEEKIDGRDAVICEVSEAVCIEGSVVRAGAMPDTSVAIVSAAPQSEHRQSGPYKAPSRTMTRDEVVAYLDSVDRETNRRLIQRLDYARAIA